jgi:hypothetical protein
MPLRRRLSATPHYAAMPPPPDYASEEATPDDWSLRRHFAILPLFSFSLRHVIAISATHYLRHYYCHYYYATPCRHLHY